MNISSLTSNRICRNATTNVTGKKQSEALLLQDHHQPPKLTFYTTRQVKPVQNSQPCSCPADLLVRESLLENSGKHQTTSWLQPLTSAFLTPKSQMGGRGSRGTMLWSLQLIPIKYQNVGSGAEIAVQELVEQQMDIHKNEAAAPDGSTHMKWKACLVTCGLQQHQGIDNEEKIATVVNFTILGLSLAVVATNNIELHQIDVKNACLNCNPCEGIFIDQPKSFIDYDYAIHVCQLIKALHGLETATTVILQKLPHLCVQLPWLYLWYFILCQKYWNFSNNYHIEFGWSA